MIDYKTATKQQLLQEFKRLKMITGDSVFFTKKEFLHFPKIALKDEVATAIASGRMDNKTWLIILTNKRVIFLDKGFLFGVTQVAVDLSKIAEVSGATSFLAGTISIATSGTSYTVKNVTKQAVIPFINLIRNAMEPVNSKNQPLQQLQKSDINQFDKLERLADLKTKGIITEEEFQTQKEKLLNL